MKCIHIHKSIYGPKLDLGVGGGNTDDLGVGGGNTCGIIRGIIPDNTDDLGVGGGNTCGITF